MDSSNRYMPLPSNEQGRQTEPNSNEDGVELVIGLESIERRRRWRRVFVFLLGVSLLAAVGVSFLFSYKYSLERRHDDDATDELEDIANDPRLERYQTPADAELCPEWPEEQGNSSTISFQIPASTSFMFFLSRGQVTGGNFLFDRAKDGATDVISVTVTARFDDHRELERTRACRASHTPSPAYSENGVLLWSESKDARVEFDITVLLPDIQIFGDVSTDLSNFSHEIGAFFDLWRPTTFEVVRLKSSNAPITVGALIGQSGFIQTSNAGVRASFFGPGKVQMQTSNALLRAVVIAFGALDGSQTDVALKTSNSPVDVSVAIMSDYPNPKLNTTVRTSNGAVNVSTSRYMPTDAKFFLDVATSNAPVKMILHPEYEGTYDLKTSVANADLLWDADLRDPTGKGRNRTLVEERGERTWKEGRMFWGEQASTDGSIKVRSSVKPVVLYSNPEKMHGVDVDVDFSDLFSQLAFLSK